SRGPGKYIADAIDLANQAQFKKGTPMIDLSGHSPGVLYAIGASSTGQAWMIGGYPGSEKLAVETLKKVPCAQISRAWLLAEPTSPNKLSSEILTSIGANMATDFEIVGAFNSPVASNSNEVNRVQQLLRPIRNTDVAMASCSA